MVPSPRLEQVSKACLAQDPTALRQALEEVDSSEMKQALQYVFERSGFKEGKKEAVIHLASTPARADVCMLLPSFITGSFFKNIPTPPPHYALIDALLDHVHVQNPSVVQMTLARLLFSPDACFIPVMTKMLDHPKFITHYDRFNEGVLFQACENHQFNPSASPDLKIIWDKVTSTLLPKEMLQVLYFLSAVSQKEDFDQTDSDFEHWVEVALQKPRSWRKEFYDMFEERNQKRKEKNKPPVCIPIRLKAFIERESMLEKAELKPSSLEPRKL